MVTIHTFSLNDNICCEFLEGAECLFKRFLKVWVLIIDNEDDDMFTCI